MGFNILIVDDSETVRAVIIKTLSLSQVNVTEIFQASNGQEALDVLAAQWIDLVFADINMPVMNGIEMINSMAEDGILKDIPVVIISTEGSKSRIAELKEKGIAAYVRKPFTPENIKEVVQQVMEQVQ